MKSQKHTNAANGRRYPAKNLRRNCKKTAYASKKIAAAIAVHQSKATDDVLVAYKCNDCHCWHIGHDHPQQGPPPIFCPYCTARIEPGHEARPGPSFVKGKLVMVPYHDGCARAKEAERDAHLAQAAD